MLEFANQGALITTQGPYTVAQFVQKLYDVSGKHFEQMDGSC